MLKAQRDTLSGNKLSYLLLDAKDTVATMRHDPAKSGQIREYPNDTRPSIIRQVIISPHGSVVSWLRLCVESRQPLTSLPSRRVDHVMAIWTRGKAFVSILLAKTSKLEQMIILFK
ncbi:hypothetical protein WR25_26245 [Diploscapter pachys]|uniref:Uncharacterized protein n=1 Tax=Diploscapter pachys TaxID=2018661 RepID=A0A2A2JST8_9BILA|nr:hypothetical protein WR25_26245 [Diploscapter pachys]